MARDRRDETMRHEPQVVARRPITQRNMTVPSKPLPADANEETFGGTRDSSIVRRDRAPKGVNDGRGKRSVEDMLLSMSTDAARATYAMERIASAEDQIARILGLCPPGTRDIIFRDRPSLSRYYAEDEE